MISSSAATVRGAATVLASGMKISAEPKPENPRATLAISATAISAASAKPLTSGRQQAGNAHPRNVPPVFFVTSATIFAATASIS